MAQPGTHSGSPVGTYLDVRYTPDRRPFTDYPAKLCAYLTERYAGVYRGGRLLDAGCGRAEFLKGFGMLGFDAVGVDGTRYSARPLGQRVVVADLDGTPLPFADSSFDVVFTKSVVEHIRNTSGHLSELHRILRKDGMLIAMTPDWRSQYRHFYDDYTHVRPFTVEGLTEAVRSQGFKVVDSRRFRQLPSVWRFPLLHVWFSFLGLLPDMMKRFKTVRFSKEWMVLVVARRA